MSGIDDLPLLVLGRVGRGRVALLASDHAWLWQRGVEGGGPLPELLRRTAHWLMKEPDLEEESLKLSADASGVHVHLQTLAEEPGAIRLLDPNGNEHTVTAGEQSPGRFTASLPEPASGSWTAEAGDLSDSIFAGPADPKEFVNAVATDRLVAPAAEETGGGIFWSEDGIPQIRQISTGRTAWGDGWLGIERRGHFRTVSASQRPLLPALLAALLAAAFCALAWRREGR